MTTARILWTTDNKETSLHMVCLYAHNAKKLGWVDEVEVLIWGASQELISKDEEVASKVKAMVKDGVKVIACQKCAENLGIVEELKSCDMQIYYTGELLSSWLTQKENIISV